MITEDVIEQAFGQLHSLAGSTWNKYRHRADGAEVGRQKGYTARPWLSDDNEIVIHKAVNKRERRLVPDVVDDKGKVKTPGEERRLLAAAGEWLWRLIVAALETGCRRAELLALSGRT